MSKPRKEAFHSPKSTRMVYCGLSRGEIPVSGTSGFRRKAVVLLGYFFFLNELGPRASHHGGATYLLMCWRDIYCQSGGRLLQLVKRLLYQAKVVLISIYINRQQRLSNRSHKAQSSRRLMRARNKKILLQARTLREQEGLCMGTTWMMESSRQRNHNIITT